MDQVTKGTDAYYNYSSTFWFEDGPKLWHVTEWVIGNGWRSSAIFSIGFVVVILAMQQLFKPYPQLRLHRSLIIWNCFLSVISLFIFLRLGQEAKFYLQHYGIKGLGKIAPNKGSNNILQFWLSFNFWCKIIELGDTVFLILRKRPITALHLLHHASTPVFVGYALMTHYWGVLRVYTVINSFIHFWMYGYYAVTSFGYKVPKFFSKMLTMAQITQMSIFLILLLYSPILDDTMEYRSNNFFYISLGVGLFNFICFIHFYYQTYIRKSQKKFQ